MKRIQLVSGLAIVVAAVVMMASPAWAQDYEAAGRHFNAAQEAYAKGKFTLAVTEYEAAFEITKDPILLYNIGEAHEKSGVFDKAVKSYRRYLVESPNASDRVEVEKRIARLEKDHKLGPATATPTTPPKEEPKKETLMELPETAPVKAEPVKTEPAKTEPSKAPGDTPPPPVNAGLLDEEKPSKVKLVAWIGVATTVALATAGAIFALAAQSRGDEISRRQVAVGPDGQPPFFDDQTRQQFTDLRNEGKTYDAVAIALLTTAGVVAVTSGVLFFVASRTGKKVEKKAAWIAPALTPNHVGLAAGWSF